MAWMSSPKLLLNVAKQRNDVSLLLLGGGSQANIIRQILMNGGVLDRVQFADKFATRPAALVSYGSPLYFILAC